MTTPFLLADELAAFLEVPPSSALSHVEILSMIQAKAGDEGGYPIDPDSKLSVQFSMGLGNMSVSRYFAHIDQHLRGPEPEPEGEIRVEISAEPEPELSVQDAILRDARAYVAARSPKLYILTPCFGGQCFVNFVTSLMDTKALFALAGFPLRVEFVKNDSLVSRARNNLVARAMCDPDMTHVIFIDNDIAWSPFDILRMVMADKSVIGGVYPLKKYDWARLVPDPAAPEEAPQTKWIANKRASQLSFMSDASVVQAKMMRYNVNYLNGQLNLDAGIAEVKHVATGFMLIQRAVFAQMFEEFPLEKYTDDVGCLSGAEHDFAYALFDCGVREGHYFSEDWLFCDRWTKMGGQVWIDVGVFLVHTGVEDYAGSYLASIVV